MIFLGLFGNFYVFIGLRIDYILGALGVSSGALGVWSSESFETPISSGLYAVYWSDWSGFLIVEADQGSYDVVSKPGDARLGPISAVCGLGDIVCWSCEHVTGTGEIVFGAWVIVSFWDCCSKLDSYLKSNWYFIPPTSIALLSLFFRISIKSFAEMTLGLGYVTVPGYGILAVVFSDWFYSFKIGTGYKFVIRIPVVLLPWRFHELDELVLCS